MGKIYQPSQDKWIPHNLYMRIIYIIRDYERLRIQRDDILEESPAPPDGMPRGTGTSDPVFQKTLKLEALSEEVKSIESAINAIPEEYRRGVLDNINGVRFPDYADLKTWKVWKRRLIYKVGENLKLL